MKRRACATITAAGLFSLSVMAMADVIQPDRQRISVIKAGAGPANEGPADHFTGKVQVQGRFQRAVPTQDGGATVTFEPGARTAWHAHPLGQTLIVTRGHGYVQEWGKPAKAIGPGDVVWIPPGVKHWHGAAPNAAMTHVAIAGSQNGNSVTWMEKVSDAQYAEALRRHD